MTITNTGGVGAGTVIVPTLMVFLKFIVTDAIPHARIGSIERFVVAVGRCAQGIEFGSIDGKPVTIVVLIAGPQDAQKPYLELLAQISKRLKVHEVRAQIAGGATAEQVVDLLTQR